ncbi:MULTISPECIES: hypothetical protein, partial [unclassified Pseudomonas]|uniref:hypothetical protein n=1 Tax=unclassified Pseudomonas TaxID=196821 RepID=UPI0021147142
MNRKGLPAIFIAISLTSLNLFQGIAIPVAVYVLGLLAGWFLALRFYSYHDVVREGDRLVLGGTVKVLIVYWCFFAWRYYAGYQEAMHPELANDVAAVVSSAVGAGLINGLIVGRSLRLLRFSSLITRCPWSWRPSRAKTDFCDSVEETVRNFVF